jgi:YD repeat-containing protein
MGSAVFRMGYQTMPGTRAPMGFVPEGQATPGGASTGFEYDQFGRRIYRNAPFGQVFDLDVETEAWQTARRLALGRLTQEASSAGADAVVGLQLRRGTLSGNRYLLEFVAIGTAVVSDRYEVPERPVLSNLSGQDFAKLFAAGYSPVGLVAGTSVIYVMTGWQQAQFSGRFRGNQELVDWTNGLQHARRVALSRVAADAQQAGAAGIVGLTLDVSRRETEHEGGGPKRKDLIVTAHVLGTAIAELARRDPAPPVGLALALGGPTP